MAEQWLIERNGHLWGPFSLEHLQGFIASGELRPDTMVLPEGGQKRIAVAAIPGLTVSAQNGSAPRGNLSPATAASAGSLAEPKARQPILARKKWVLAGAGVAVVIVGLVWIASSRRAQPQVFPDLPEWFQPAYRVKPVRYPVPEGWVSVEGLGWVPPGEVPPPGNFTEEWLERNFTHYLKDGTYYFARPKWVMPSDGKLIKGRKVIFGEQVNDEFSLICVRTDDGRAVNMFIRSLRLRERSKGPPPPDED